MHARPLAPTHARAHTHHARPRACAGERAAEKRDPLTPSALNFNLNFNFNRARSAGERVAEQQRRAMQRRREAERERVVRMARLQKVSHLGQIT